MEQRRYRSRHLIPMFKDYYIIIIMNPIQLLRGSLKSGLIKETLEVISIDHSCKDDNVRFITEPWKPDQFLTMFLFFMCYNFYKIKWQEACSSIIFFLLSPSARPQVLFFLSPFARPFMGLVFVKSIITHLEISCKFIELNAILTPYRPNKF